MKKKSRILLMWLCLIILIGASVGLFSACAADGLDSSSGAYEEKLLGTWVCHSGTNTIMYVFEKEADGTYTAGCITSSGIYAFDEFSASKRVITFRQNGKQTKHNYFFEDDYLYIDDLEFERVK